MSHLDSIEFIDSDEAREFPTRRQCSNCEANERDGFYITEAWGDDGKNVLLCDDCREEQERVEKQADELVKLPSCEARQRIIDEATTTGGLVNALRAHDMHCPVCGGKRKPVEVAHPHHQERKAA
jgi:DNA-directed RNA polymerase subunit M/transcription elongation factor TFIIS